MRGIVFGLIFSNLVFLAWNLFVPTSTELREPAPTEQVGQGVQLVSEVAAQQLRRYPAQQAEPAPSLAESADVPAQVPAEARPLYCAQIGPFRNEEDAQNFSNTHAQRMSLSVDVRQIPAAPDYRVFLPPFASKELAASTEQALRAAFVANNISIDTYLVPRGELENSIALGLFGEHSNALNVQRQMQNLGYQVVVREEPKQTSEVWVIAADIESADVFAAQWSQMRLTRSYIDAGEKLCETIAQPPQFP